VCTAHMPHRSQYAAITLTTTLIRNLRIHFEPSV